MKQALFFLLFFLLVFISKAQLEYGIKAGFNRSDITHYNLDPKLGLNIGGFAYYQISENFALQPELLFSMQGVKNGDYSTISKNYLNIPLVMKFKVGRELNLQAGEYVGVLLSAKEKNEVFEINDKDITKAFDFGLVFGLGYDYSANLSIDLRYNLGFTEITHSSEDPKNTVLSLSVGYKFSNFY